MLTKQTIAEMYAKHGLMPIGGGENDQPGEPDDPETPVEEHKPVRVEFSPDQQNKINSIVAEETKKAVAAALAARDEADREDKERKRKEDEKKARELMREQGKQDELIVSLTADVERLERQVEQLTESAAKYEQIVTREYDTLVTDLPTALKVWDPGPDASIEEKSRFMELARKSMSELDEPYRPGNPPSPPPSRTPNPTGNLVDINTRSKTGDSRYQSVSG